MTSLGDISIGLRLDVDGFKKQLQAFQKDQQGLSIKVGIDQSSLRKQLEGIKGAIAVGVKLDATALKSSLKNLTIAPITVGVTAKLDTKALQASLKAIIMPALTVGLSMGKLDTRPLQAQLNAFKKLDIQVVAKLDTRALQTQLNAIRQLNIQASVTIKTTGIQAQLRELSTFTIQAAIALKTTGLQAQLRDLKFAPVQVPVEFRLQASRALRRDINDQIKDAFNGAISIPVSAQLNKASLAKLKADIGAESAVIQVRVTVDRGSLAAAESGLRNRSVDIQSTRTERVIEKRERAPGGDGGDAPKQKQKVQLDPGDEIQDAIAKSVEEGTKKASQKGLFGRITGVGAEIMRGFQQGTGQEYARRVASGTIKTLEKELGTSLNKVGEQFSEKLGGAAKFAGRQLVDKGAKKLGIEDGYAGVLRQLKNLEAFAEQFKMPDLFDEKALDQKFKVFELAIGRVIDNLLELKSVQDQVEGFKGVGDAALGVADLRWQGAQKAYGGYKQERIQEAARLAQERANLIMPPKMAPGQDAVIAMAGFAAEGGAASKKIGAQAQQMFGQNTKVVPVANRNLDVKTSALENPAMWMAQVMTRVMENTMQGFAPDAIEAAAQAIAIKRQNPDAKVDFLGHSGGGFIAEDAVQIMGALGYDDTRGVGIGTPRMGFSGQNPANYQSIMGDEDGIFAVQQAGAAFMPGMNFAPGMNVPSSTVMRGEGYQHRPSEYMGRKPTQEQIAMALGRDAGSLAGNAAEQEVLAAGEMLKQLRRDMKAAKRGDKAPTATYTNMVNRLKLTRERLADAMQEASTELAAQIEQYLQEVDKTEEAIAAQFDDPLPVPGQTTPVQQKRRPPPLVQDAINAGKNVGAQIQQIPGVQVAAQIGNVAATAASDAVKEVVYAVGDAAVAALEVSTLNVTPIPGVKDGFTTAPKPLQDQATERTQAFRDEFTRSREQQRKDRKSSVTPEQAAETSRVVTDAKKGLVAAIVGTIKATQDAISGAKKAVVSATVAPVIDTGLRTYREQALQDRAIPLVEQRAKDIAEGKKDKRYVSDKSYSNAQVVDADTKELIIASGGFAGAGGLSGKRIPGMLKDMMPEGAKAIWVQNRDNDLDRHMKNAGGADKAFTLFRSLAKPNLRGYSEDAVEMAAQAKAAFEKNPEIKIKLLGESGGGFVAEEAAKILEMMKIPYEYLSVGTPDFAGRLNAKNGQKIMSGDESLGREAQAVYSQWGLADVSSEGQQVLGLKGHPIEHYLNAGTAELQNFIYGAPEPLSPEELKGMKSAANQFKAIDTKGMGTKEIDALNMQAQANMERVRRYYLTATGQTKKELAEIVETFRAVYIKTAPESGNLDAVRASIERSQEILAEVLDDPSENAKKVAAKLAKELQAIKKNFRSEADSKKTAGTDLEKVKLLEAELDTLIRAAQKPDEARKKRDRARRLEKPSNITKEETGQIRDVAGQFQAAAASANPRELAQLGQLAAANAAQIREKLAGTTGAIRDDLVESIKIFEGIQFDANPEFEDFQRVQQALDQAEKILQQVLAEPGEESEKIAQQILKELDVLQSQFTAKRGDSFGVAGRKFKGLNQRFDTIKDGITGKPKTQPTPAPQPTQAPQAQPTQPTPQQAPTPAQKTPDQLFADTYRQLVGATAQATGMEVPEDQLPKLNIQDLGNPNARGAYNSVANEIVLPPNAVEEIQAILGKQINELTDDEIKTAIDRLSTIAHEAFHGAQHGFTPGSTKKKLAESGGVKAPTMDATRRDQDAMKWLRGKSISESAIASANATNQAPSVQKLQGAQRQMVEQINRELEQGAYTYQAKFVNEFLTHLQEAQDVGSQTVAEALAAVIANLEVAMQPEIAAAAAEAKANAPDNSQAQETLNGFNTEILGEIARVSGRSGKGKKQEVIDDLIANVDGRELAEAIAAVKPMIETGPKGGQKLKKQTTGDVEKQLIAATVESEKRLQAGMKELQTAKGARRKRLIDAMIVEINNSTNAMMQLATQQVSGSDRKEIGSRRGRIEAMGRAIDPKRMEETLSDIGAGKAPLVAEPGMSLAEVLAEPKTPPKATTTPAKPPASPSAAQPNQAPPKGGKAPDMGKVGVPVTFDVQWQPLKKTIDGIRTQLAAGFKIPVMFDAQWQPLKKTVDGIRAQLAVGLKIPVTFDVQTAQAAAIIQKLRGQLAQGLPGVVKFEKVETAIAFSMLQKLQAQLNPGLKGNIRFDKIHTESAAAQLAKLQAQLNPGLKGNIRFEKVHTEVANAAIQKLQAQLNGGLHGVVKFEKVQTEVARAEMVKLQTQLNAGLTGTVKFSKVDTTAANEQIQKLQAQLNGGLNASFNVVMPADLGAIQGQLDQLGDRLAGDFKLKVDVLPIDFKALQLPSLAAELKKFKLAIPTVPVDFTTLNKQLSGLTAQLKTFKLTIQIQPIDPGAIAAVTASVQLPSLAVGVTIGEIDTAGIAAQLQTIQGELQGLTLSAAFNAPEIDPIQAQLQAFAAQWADGVWVGVVLELVGEEAVQAQLTKLSAQLKNGLIGTVRFTSVNIDGANEQIKKLQAQLNGGGLQASVKVAMPEVDLLAQFSDPITVSFAADAESIASLTQQVSQAIISGIQQGLAGAPNAEQAEVDNLLGAFGVGGDDISFDLADPTPRANPNQPPAPPMNANIAGDAAEKLNQTAEAAENATKQTSGLGQAFAAGQGAVGLFLRALDGIENGLNKLFPQLGSIGTLVRQTIVGFLGFQVASQIGRMLGGFAKDSFQAAIALTNFKTALNFASGGASQGAQNLAFVRAEVQRLNVPLGASIEGFTKLAAATRGTAVEGEQTRKLFTGISEASRVFGLSAEQTGGAILALSQMASKGSVQAEELRGQLGERIPGAMGIAARAMGVTERQLGKMMETGSVMASDFLPKFGKQLSIEMGEAAKNAANTVQGSMQKAQNAILSLQQSAGGSFDMPMKVAFDGVALALQGIGAIAPQLMSLLLASLGALAAFLGNVLLAQIKLSGGTLIAVLGSAKAALMALNTSFMAIATVGIFAVIEGVRALYNAVNTDMVVAWNNLGTAAEAAGKRMEEAANRGRNPNPNGKPGLQDGNPIVNWWNDTTTLGVGGFIDQAGDAAIRGQWWANIPGIKDKIQEGRGQNNFKSLERDNITSQINDLVTRGDVFRNTGEGMLRAEQQTGELQGLDAQLGNKESQRRELQGRMQREFTNKGLAIPAELQGQLRAINGEINAITEKRGAVADSITQGVQGASTLIDTYKAAINDLSDPKNARKYELLNIDVEAEKAKLQAQLDATQAFKDKYENALASMKIDPVLRLASAFAELSKKLAKAAEDAERFARAQKTATTQQQVAGFSTNIDGARQAATKNAQTDLNATNQQLAATESALNEYQGVLNETGSQQAIQESGLSMESSTAEIEAAIQALGDSAENAGKKKVLEALKGYKDAVDKVGQLKNQQANQELAVKQAIEAETLAKIDRGAQWRENSLKRRQNERDAERSMQQAAITRKRATGALSADDAAIASAKLQEENARDDYSAAEEREASVKQQMDELKANKDNISAEEYYKRETELVNQMYELKAQKAQSLVAIEEAAAAKIEAQNRKIIKAFELSIKKAEAAIAISLSARAEGNARTQIAAGGGGELADQATTNSQLIGEVAAAKERMALKQKEMSFNAMAGARGIKDKHDAAMTEVQLMTELAGMKTEAAQKELALIKQLRQAKIEYQKASYDMGIKELELNDKLLDAQKRLVEAIGALEKAQLEAAAVQLQGKLSAADWAMELAKIAKWDPNFADMQAPEKPEHLYKPEELYGDPDDNPDDPFRKQELERKTKEWEKETQPDQAQYEKEMREFEKLQREKQRTERRIQEEVNARRKRAAQEQLAALGMGTTEREVALAKAEIEDRIAEKKAEAMQLELAMQQKSLEFEYAKFRIAQERAKLEAERELVDAKRKADDAQLAMTIAQKDVKDAKSPEEKAAAEVILKKAQLDQQMAQRQLQFAGRNYLAQDAITNLGVDAFAAQFEGLAATRESKQEEMRFGDMLREQKQTMDLIGAGASIQDQSILQRPADYNPNRKSKVDEILGGQLQAPGVATPIAPSPDSLKFLKDTMGGKALDIPGIKTREQQVSGAITSIDRDNGGMSGQFGALAAAVMKAANKPTSITVNGSENPAEDAATLNRKIASDRVAQSPQF